MKPAEEPEPITPPESRKDSWESIFEDLGDREPVAAKDVLYSSGRSTASGKDVALLVLDVAPSTRLVREIGDTQFSKFMSSMHRIARKHQSASELIFMKNTGDGFLAALNTVSAAFALAVRFLETHNYEKAHIRLALHWGAVKFGPTGEVLGREVRLVSGIEGVKITDRVDEEKDKVPLPRFDRLLVTRKAFTLCDAAIQAKCKPAGKFYIRNLGTSADLWVYSHSPRGTSCGDFFELLRKCKTACGALVKCAFNPHLAAILFDQLFAQQQAQPRPLFPGCAGSLITALFMKQFCEILCADSHAGISNGKLDTVVVLYRGDLDMVAGKCIF